MKVVSRMLSILALSLGIAGCGSDTGSPGSRHLNGGQQNLVADHIVQTTCQKLASCHPELKSSTCVAGLYTQTNLDTEFGLFVDEFPKFSDVRDAEGEGKILVSRIAGQLCADDVKLLTCEDDVVKNAYRPEEADPFEQAEKLFSPVCESVYPL